MNYSEEANRPGFYDLLIVEYLSGKITRKELSRLRQWLDNNDKNKDHFNRMKASWHLAGRTSQKETFDTVKCWEKVYGQIHSHSKTRPVKEKRRSVFLNVWSYAAAGLILIALGSLLTLFIARNSTYSHSAMTEISAPLGSRCKISLPDGSTIWLNAGSTLKYPGNLNSLDCRKVELAGEGFFKVTANPEKPFVVKACDLDIIAFGTSFNVKAYPQEQQIVTTLVEGKVSIINNDSKKRASAITMEPNQKITYYTDNRLFESELAKKEMKESGKSGRKKSMPVVNEPELAIIKDINVKTVLYTSWKDKRWIIEGESLDNLAVMLERRYNVTIHLKAPELNTYSFSGILENETLEQVFQILRLTVPISYRIEKGMVEISLDKELKKKYESAY
ncbi:MAG: FecR family protein [Bacteroidales bacterium]|nr:FecR family protein [Bacteroidales bacterium]